MPQIISRRRECNISWGRGGNRAKTNLEEDEKELALAALGQLVQWSQAFEILTRQLQQIRAKCSANKSVTLILAVNQYPSGL